MGLYSLPHPPKGTCEPNDMIAYEKGVVEINICIYMNRHPNIWDFTLLVHNTYKMKT